MLAFFSFALDPFFVPAIATSDALLRRAERKTGILPRLGPTTEYAPQAASTACQNHITSISILVTFKKTKCPIWRRTADFFCAAAEPVFVDQAAVEHDICETVIGGADLADRRSRLV